MDNEELVERLEKSFTLNNLSPRALADFLGLPWPHEANEIPQKRVEEKPKAHNVIDLKAALRKRNKRGFDSRVANVGAK